MARKKRKRGGRNHGNGNRDTQRMLAETLQMQTRILALLEYGEERRQRPRRAVLTPRPDAPQGDLPLPPPPPPPPLTFPPTPPEILYDMEQQQQQREDYLPHMDEEFLAILAQTIHTMREQGLYPASEGQASAV